MKEEETKRERKRKGREEKHHNSFVDTFFCIFRASSQRYSRTRPRAWRLFALALEVSAKTVAVTAAAAAAAAVASTAIAAIIVVVAVAVVVLRALRPLPVLLLLTLLPLRALAAPVSGAVLRAAVCHSRGPVPGRRLCLGGAEVALLTVELA